MDQFAQLLSLDDELRHKFIKTALTMWNQSLHEKAPYVKYEITTTVAREIEDGIIVTGSMAEGMATARLFKTPELGSDLDGEVEVDVMFHVIVFPNKEVQDEFLVPIKDKIGFFKVRNSAKCEKFIPVYIRHRFDDAVHSPNTSFISGSVIKERAEEVIRFKDSDNQIVKTAAQLLNVEVSDVTVGYKSEINGPAVTLSFQFKFRDGRQLLGEGDGVSCMKLPMWPYGADAFVRRKRQACYPGKQMLNDIVNEGVHIVPKMTANGCDPEEWRLSFSIAEKILAENRSEHLRLTYMIFKSMYYAHIKPIKEGDISLPSYFAKTVMLWACEEYPAEEWGKENMENNLGRLFAKLGDSFGSRQLKHYFLPEINLLDPYTNTLIKMAGEKISLIIANPMQYMPRAHTILNAISQTNELIRIVDKFSEWADMCEGGLSIARIVQKLSSDLPEALKGGSGQGRLGVLQGISQVVRLFDTSRTTRNNLNKIDAVLGATASVFPASQPGTPSSKPRKQYEDTDLD